MLAMLSLTASSHLRLTVTPLPAMCIASKAPISWSSCAERITPYCWSIARSASW